ncbi:erythromycin esterase family protein [Solihabitans fulvus]|uniref:Erythromycin esterase family protein n=1 Tax=Solihabitans fulvus TaxID=1892852 RepID=A0A5B2X7Z0_9PSEU|nr:erythromycin esterase family protein [Solihabitans fulvus]KAA2259527.1 erythromycin esterase family protein [Solihabitans fulvus]
MSQDIRDFVTASAELVAIGEPTHQEPAFARVRNELFVQLIDRGVRSIALETDRVAALAVNDFVQDGVGTLDVVLSEGFSHDFGALVGNRNLVSWMRDHNRSRPSAERLAFHGFDAPTENTSAPSPRRYLEHARDYLGLDVDLAGLAGDDEQWGRTEAILDPAMSMGATAEAERLRSAAEDLLTALHARAPELIAATSRDEWFRAKTQLTAGLDLLRYHKQAAQRLDRGPRLSRLLATRDAIMAKNLLDIRTIEAQRGATLVCAHNAHLQKSPSTLRMTDEDFNWIGAGAIVSALLGEKYTFFAGSLGRSDALGLAEPAADTYEGFLQGRSTIWGLTLTTEIPSARTRADTIPERGYYALDRVTLDGADAVLHISDGASAGNTMSGTGGLSEPVHGGRV